MMVLYSTLSYISLTRLEMDLLLTLCYEFYMCLFKKYSTMFKFSEYSLQNEKYLRVKVLKNDCKSKINI